MTPRPHDRIYASPAEAIGGAPMVRLPRFAGTAAPKAELLALCDFRHPLGGGAAREAAALIAALVEERALAPGGTLVEGASASAAVSLAAAAAAAGVRLHVVAPAPSAAAQAMIAYLGAALTESPAAQGVAGAAARAVEIAEATPGAAGPALFDHPACARAHAETTGVEIWRETGGELDAVVIGFGTGAELGGIAGFLRDRRSLARVVAVEPQDCPLLSGGQPGPHRIDGLGPGFVPARVLRDAIDETICVGDRAAFETARRAAQAEGLALGAASGAVLAAAAELARRPESEGKRIVAVLPTGAETELELAPDIAAEDAPASAPCR